MKIASFTRVTWAQVAVSLLVAGLGLTGTHALGEIDADLHIIYQEYTLAAVDLGHISADVLRNRVIRQSTATSRPGRCSSLPSGAPVSYSDIMSERIATTHKVHPPKARLNRSIHEGIPGGE